jgi:heme-degrading monooxygenase HmoA
MRRQLENAFPLPVLPSWILRQPSIRRQTLGDQQNPNQKWRVPMSVRVLIKRRAPQSETPKLTELLKRMRSFSLAQPGYVYGETLARHDNPEEYLVISTWRSIEDWNNWLNNPQRVEVQQEIDLLLGEETEYAVYEHI